MPDRDAEAEPVLLRCAECDAVSPPDAARTRGATGERPRYRRINSLSSCAAVSTFAAVERFRAQVNFGTRAAFRLDGSALTRQTEDAGRARPERPPTRSSADGTTTKPKTHPRQRQLRVRE
jgi:hypothetical protein